MYRQTLALFHLPTYSGKGPKPPLLREARRERAGVDYYRGNDQLVDRILDRIGRHSVVFVIRYVVVVHVGGGRVVVVAVVAVPVFRPVRVARFGRIALHEHQEEIVEPKKKTNGQCADEVARHYMVTQTHCHRPLYTVITGTAYTVVTNARQVTHTARPIATVARPVPPRPLVDTP